MSRADYKRRYYAANRERLRAKERERLARNPTARAKQRDWHIAHPERRVVVRAKYRAKCLGLAFNLTNSDIHIPAKCPILGTELSRGAGKPAHSSPSLDRLVPEKGYVRGNIQVISHLANSMKQNATPDQLKRFAEWVRRTYE